MNGASQNHAAQIDAIKTSYEQAVRTGNDSKVKTLRAVNKDCTHLFDRVDKQVVAEV